MTSFILFVLKSSISLGLVYLFYRLFLRRLTFYNSNRWYLLGYTLLSFLVPFVDVSPYLDSDRSGQAGIIRFIPAIISYANDGAVGTQSNSGVSAWDQWAWLTFIVAVGAILLMIRFTVFLLSFLRLRRTASLVSSNAIKLYQVDKSIIPFSFGNAVFINKGMHSETELSEIIRHEIVHVKQKHTIDIIWAEILCMLSWYNPFAWLLRAAIRQNLEFIADHEVLQHGIQKKTYQYLLLKVMGNDQYSIAQKFNFSSLKKRIAMMNKLKTTRVHLLRFLFIVPLLAVILVSFRQKKLEQTVTDVRGPGKTYVIRDTIPMATEPNEKGYIVYVTGKPGSATVVVKDKNGKLVERVPYKKWQDDDSYADKYGNFPPPPPPHAPPMPPAPPVPMELPEGVKKIDVKEKKATVLLKDGTEEKYDLSKPEEKAKFEKKYGDIIPPPPAIPPRAPGSYEISATQELNRTRIADEFEITDNHKAHMRLKDGTVEEYDLSNAKEKEEFETKYGKVVEVNAPVEGSVAPIKVVSVIDGRAVLVPTRVEGKVAFVDETGAIVNGGEEEVLVTVTKKTSKEQLKTFVEQMKDRGVELKFDNTNYNDGVLIHIDGTMKFEGSRSNFSATDFNKLIISVVKDDGHSYLHVKVSDNKRVI